MEKHPAAFPVMGLVLAGLAALVFVGGTLLNLLGAGDDGGPEASEERPTLQTLMEDTDLVVRGPAEVVRRLGEPRDPGVVVLVGVDETLVPAEADLAEVLIYDKGFREDWREGQEVLLFLGSEDGLPEGAKFRVRERCILDPEGALECPYELTEVRRSGRDV